jgi:hypothetical protein
MQYVEIIATKSNFKLAFIELWICSINSLMIYNVHFYFNFRLMLCFYIRKNVSIKSEVWILVIHTRFFDIEIILSKIINVQLLRFKHLIKQASLTFLSIVNYFFNVEIYAYNVICNDESYLYNTLYFLLRLILYTYYSLWI